MLDKILSGLLIPEDLSKLIISYLSKENKVWQILHNHMEEVKELATHHGINGIRIFEHPKSPDTYLLIKLPGSKWKKRKFQFDRALECVMLYNSNYHIVDERELRPDHGYQHPFLRDYNGNHIATDKFDCLNIIYDAIPLW